jgi:hypothetical protein
LLANAESLYGRGDEPSFRRLFKEHTGLAPKFYRNKFNMAKPVSHPDASDLSAEPGMIPVSGCFWHMKSGIYFSGHSHSLQHAAESAPYFTSGGGGHSLEKSVVDEGKN